MDGWADPHFGMNRLMRPPRQGPMLGLPVGMALRISAGTNQTLIGTTAVRDSMSPSASSGEASATEGEAGENVVGVDDHRLYLNFAADGAPTVVHLLGFVGNLPAILRLVTLAVAIASLGLSSTAVSASWPPRPAPTVETDPDTVPVLLGVVLEPEQEELVDWARTRFERAGFELPEVGVQFNPNIMACNGRVGLYDSNSDLIVMCQVDKMSVLHELAHAWARSALTEGDRAAFTSLRSLKSWNDHNLAWAERATEHAAEILTWALMDRNTLVPSMTIADTGEAEKTWQLPTIGNSNPDQLVEAYESLTGHSPVERLEDDPRLVPPVEAFSLEVRDLLAPLDDVYDDVYLESPFCGLGDPCFTSGEVEIGMAQARGGRHVHI